MRQRHTIRQRVVESLKLEHDSEETRMQVIKFKLEGENSGVTNSGRVLKFSTLFRPVRYVDVENTQAAYRFERVF